MPAKPSDLPLWATTPDPGGNVEPSGAQQIQGWPVGGYQPPGEWFNWWMNLVYQWTVWLNDFEGTAHTWAELQTFSKGIAVNQSVANTNAVNGNGNGNGRGIAGFGGATGDGVYGYGGGTSGSGGVFDGLDAGVSATARATGNGKGGNFSGDGTGHGVTAAGGASGSGLVGTIGSGGGSAQAGVIALGDTLGAAIRASNNIGTKPTIVAENDAGAPAVLARARTGGAGVGLRGTGRYPRHASALGLEVFAEDADSDNAGPAPGYHKTLGKIWGGLKLDGENPAYNLAFVNEVTNTNITKVWAKFKFNGTATPLFLDGFNIASITQASDGLCTVTFASNFENVNYAVEGRANLHNYSLSTEDGVSANAVGSMTFYTYSTVGGAAYVLQARNVLSDVIVTLVFHGRQAS